MKQLQYLLGTAASSAFILSVWLMLPAPVAAGECTSGLCGTPNQSGGGCGCGCGSILVAMTDRGDTYQFADDFDGDGMEDEFDNCPFTANFEQLDGDGDSVGDACDVCAGAANADQSDVDLDGIGDACDSDSDGDQILDAQDNCQAVYNPSQTNTDAASGNNTDNLGDACDPDDDGDGVLDFDDPCRLIFGGAPGEVGCEDDVDGDEVLGNEDNCPTIRNPRVSGAGGAAQPDMDGDGAGDACDLDIDEDGLDNYRDNCPSVFNPSQSDEDRDGLGDGGVWGSGGVESCDPTECYVIGGSSGGCLDPTAQFQIDLLGVSAVLPEEPSLEVFKTGKEIIVALFTNRLHEVHNWTARIERLPGDSNVALENARGAATTLNLSPQVVNCESLGSDGSCARDNSIRFTPDAPGTYVIQVTAELPDRAEGDPLGAVAQQILSLDVGGEDQSGGCAGAGAGATGLGALTLGLIALLGRRRHG